MKKLEEYTENELKNELSRRQYQENRKLLDTIPKNTLPYKEIDAIVYSDNGDKHSKIFYAHVDDGAEGLSYLIQYDHKPFSHVFDDDELINDTVKHAYLTYAEEGEWEPNFEGVSCELLGHYGITMLSIDGTNRKDEDE